MASHLAIRIGQAAQLAAHPLSAPQGSSVSSVSALSETDETSEEAEVTESARACSYYSS